MNLPKYIVCFNWNIILLVIKMFNRKQTIYRINNKYNVYIMAIDIFQKYLCTSLYKRPQGDGLRV